VKTYFSFVEQALFICSGCKVIKGVVGSYFRSLSRYTKSGIAIAWAWLSVVLLICGTGCPAVNNLPAPGRVLEQDEPVTGRSYYLYVPEKYRENRDWPLIVACHGTPPWDRADLQLKEWKGLAEAKGFLLAVPKLKGVRGDFPPKPAEQIRLQKADEKAILSVVKAVRASHSVDRDRVFLTGWSAGGYAVLFTGLRNPDVFRALSVSQGNFDPAFVEPCSPFVEPYQAVQIIYNSEDFALQDDAVACIDWLRNHGIQPEVLERPGFHQRDPKPIFQFFAQCVRHRPWIRIHVREDADDPMQVRFRTKCSFQPRRYLWDFGDGVRSEIPEPEHNYSKPGGYLAKVALWAPNGKTYVRKIKLEVPRIHLGTQPRARITRTRPGS